jgi:ABC-2 type transport system permease protein
MNRIWIIAVNDVRLFLQDKSAYVWLFIIPMFFTCFFGMAMKGDSGKPKAGKAAVFIENDDAGFMGEMLVVELTRQGVDIVPRKRRETAPRGVRIPEDFTENVQNRRRARIEFYKIKGGNDEAAFLIQLKLFKAALRLNSDLFSLVTERREQEITEESFRRMAAREAQVELAVSYAGRKKVPGGFDQSVPGFMVMFVLMNLLFFGALSISGERAGGVIRRLGSCSVSKAEVIGGKLLGRFLLGVVQIGFFMAAGKLLFQLDYAGNGLLVLLTMLVYAWGCAALGLLIGAVFVGEEKVSGLCLLISMLCAALGGCWWPIEMVPDTMRAIGHLFPTAWAMDALHQLISFQGGLREIGKELAVLFGFGLAFTLAAAKALRW